MPVLLYYLCRYSYSSRSSRVVSRYGSYSYLVRLAGSSSATSTSLVVLSGFLGKDAARCGVWCVVCGVASFLVLEVGSWDCVDDFTCDKSDV